jgi:hypothetical protein
MPSINVTKVLKLMSNSSIPNGILEIIGDKTGQGLG